MNRRWIYCKECQRKLFRVAFADLEIKCKCGTINVIRIYTASALILTADESSDMIETYKQSKEDTDPDCEAPTA